MTTSHATGTVTCDECGTQHTAEYSHDGRFGEGAVYAVVCGDFTDYYTEERVTRAPVPTPEETTMSTTIITSYVAPGFGPRQLVAVVRWQGRDYTVKQSAKKVTTVWLDGQRITKAAHPGAFHTLVGAAFEEWERPAREAELIKAAAENPAATPAELAYDGGRTAQAAAELSAPAERITCGQCGAELTRVQPADGGSYWGHADPALDGHPEAARRGPSPEVVKAAVTRFQAELTANADAIGAILSEDSSEPGPVSVAESINPHEWSVRRDGELLGTVRRERGTVGWWEAVDTSGITRVRKANTRSDAAARLVAGIDQRAADRAEREAADAAEGQRWAPQRQLPSGKYGVRLDTARTYTGPEPVLHVVQLIKPATVDSPARWGATPGRWGATTLAGHTGSTLAIDYGQGWALDEVDTLALVAYAAELSTC